MKKLFKFIFKQIIKCFIIFFVSSLCFYCCSHVKAFADYAHDSGITFNYGTTEGFHVSSTVVVPDNALYLRINDITANFTIDRLQYSYGSMVNTGSYSSTVNITNGSEIDVSAYQGQNFRIRVWSARGSSYNSSIISSSDISFVFAGSDPDLGTASYEQRYNTDYVYSSSFTQSLTERVIFCHWYPDDLFPNMNSIEVNASTVGNNQLQFRIGYISNGVRIGSSAWFDSGFKMPISDQVEYDYLSIGLRLPDPDDPTGFYDLQVSELDMCNITVGYRTKVYMSLEPAEEIPLTTQDFSIEVPTIDFNDLDTANINGFDDYITIIAQSTSGLLSASGILPFAIFLFVLSVIFFFLVG